eukprot:SAG11_NODE_11576_length_751_cov_1.027607_1_plen_121_part_01
MMERAAYEDRDYEQEDEEEEEEGDIFDGISDEEFEEDEEDESEEEEEEDYGSMEHYQLVQRVREMEQAMRQAAAFGQQMMEELQQLELAKSEITRLQAELDECHTQVEEGEWRIEELENQK